MENTLTRKKQIITAKALTTVIGITLSVAIPQLFHVIGIVSGTGSLPGSAFLPMHLGVFFTALLAGPAVGAVTGAVSPLLSFALTGMPSAALLPFMMIELTVYGLVCGLLKNKKMLHVGQQADTAMGETIDGERSPSQVRDCSTDCPCNIGFYPQSSSFLPIRLRLGQYTLG